MSMTFEMEDVTALCGGEWLGPMPAFSLLVGIEDDSRSVQPGNLFVALKGTLTDGHRYIQKAVEAGAAAVLVQERPSAEILSCMASCGCGCLLVKDSLKAYHLLARAYRRRFPQLPVIGVTGSCGKTSTKEMIAAVLERKYPGHVVKTQGNTNNFWGAPRNLFRIDDTTQAAVIEMGSNYPGEIDRLAWMAEPTCGVVCNIGEAHLEFFGDLRGVAEEKGDLLARTAFDGPCIMPYDAAGLDLLKRHAVSRPQLLFGAGEDCDVQGHYLGVRDGGYGLRLVRRETGEAVELTWHIGGAHQAVNAAAAAAVGLTLGMTLDEIAEGLRGCVLPGARMNVEEIDGIHWVNDSYNANPSSMRASLEWFSEISRGAGKRILVLGDMLELGESSENAHRELLTWTIGRFGKDAVMTVGPRMKPFAEAWGLRHTETVQECQEKGLLQDIPRGSWVLLKASNSIGLSQLMPQQTK